MKQLTETYLARDEWGRSYTIYVYNEIVSAVVGGAAETAPELRTADGEPLQLISPGVYQAQMSGRRLWLDQTPDNQGSDRANLRAA